MAERHVEIWEQVLERCRGLKGLSASSVAIWLEPGQAVGIEEGRLVVTFPADRFAWVGRRYRTLLGEVVRDIDGDLAGVRLRKEPPMVANERS